MFRGKNESYEDYEKRIQRTAEILFPNTPDKPKKFEEKKSPKILPLGKSIFDEEDKAGRSCSTVSLNTTKLFEIWIKDVCLWT